MLLLLTLIVGVVTMHSTIACHMGGEREQAPGRHAQHTVSASMTESDPLRHSLEAGFSPSIAEPSVEAVEPIAGHDPLDSALHALLHLCLAILTGLLALGVLALCAVMLTGVIRAAPRTVGRSVTGPRAPPPTSLRLAQLCVLRN